MAFVASEAKGSHFSGVAFVMGRGGGRTVPLLVVVGPLPSMVASVFSDDLNGYLITEIDVHLDEERGGTVCETVWRPCNRCSR